jgi:CheY-specific phosphatase CheX
MKSIKDNIVYINYPSIFSERNTKLMIQELKELKSTLQERELSGIFISIKNLHISENDLKLFLEELEKTSKYLLTDIALGNYNNSQFLKLKDLSKDLHVKLFKTANIARLFFNPKSFNKILKVLLLDDEESEDVERQASHLTRYEHSMIYAHSASDFQEKIENNGIDIAISQTRLNLPLDKTKTTFCLSKNLVLNLPLFIDTAVDTLETLTGLSSQKTSHVIAPFKSDINEQIISSLMRFRGDIEGSFVLVFPKTIALQAIEAMIGESIDPKDSEAISDGVAEFCNIITGSTKTHFSKKDIKVIFDLPKTYMTLATTKSAVGENSGIWIDMKLEEKPFYMFITK